MSTSDSTATAAWASGRAAGSDQVVPGITRRHSRRCESRRGGSCSCRPTYQAQAWSARDRKPVRRTFSTLSAARAWRQEAQVDLRRRRMNAPTARLVRDAAAEWLEGARAGVVRTRSGEPYKPSALRSYEEALKRTILPDLGHLRLSALSRPRIQVLVDRMVAGGLAPSTVANAILPLRAIYRRALESEEVVLNPTERLALPKQRRGRDRVAEPREVEALLAVLPPRHRVLWAAAVYSGLRRGELQALLWSAIELDAGILRVERSWDRVAGPVAPKSRSGERTVPIPSSLRAELLTHRLRQGSGGVGFVFSATGEQPFDPSNALRAARRVWQAAGLRPLGFHQCRHTYASFMIAAGVNAKALSAYMGHSSITVTLDRYGHLMPGNERQAAALLEAFLERGRGPLRPRGRSLAGGEADR
jgi:integrase